MVIVLGLLVFIIVLESFVFPQIRKKENEKIGHPVTIPFDYTVRNGRFFYELKQTFFHRHIMKRKLLVDMRFYLSTPDVTKPNVKPIKSLECKQYWTDYETKDIHKMGYLPVERLHDSLAWVGVPIYLRFDNPQKFEVPQDKDEKNHYLYSQDTPSTLYDKWHSNATKDFIRNMSKLGMREIDTQTIIMIGICAGGALVGMWLLGII